MPFISQYKYIECKQGRQGFLLLMNQEAKESWKPVWKTLKEGDTFSIYLYRKVKVNRLIGDPLR